MHRLVRFWLLVAMCLGMGASIATAATTTLPELTNAWEKAHLHMVDKDTNGVFINANGLFLDTLRPKVQSLGDLVGKTDFDFYPNDLATGYRAADQKVLASGVTFELVEKYQAADGSTAFILTTKTPLRDSAGSIYALRIVFYPIPEPGQTTLPEFATEWLRTHAISIDKDTNSVFLNANENFLKTLRPSFPEIKTVTNLIGRDDSYFYAPDLAEKFRADDRQVMTRGIALDIIEDNQPVGGLRTTHQVFKRPLRRADGTLYGLRILSWEIPNLKIRQFQQSLEIAFPEFASTFALQTSTSANEGAAWETIPTTGTNAGVVTAVASPANAQGHFRLAHFEPEPEQWAPDRPITLVVPYGVNGSSDQLARLLARVLEKGLGVKIYVVNVTGNSGANGTAAVLGAPRDGYTWLAGPSANLGLYKITGLLDTRPQDWNYFLPIQHAQVFSVAASSPYQTFDQLLAAFKSKPEGLKVGNAGRVAAGSVAMQLLRQKTGINYTTTSYNSGAEASAALVAGAVEMIAQTYSDSIDLIPAGKIRPLATLGSQPLVATGFPQPIQPVSQWVPGLAVDGNYFGFMLPKGTPANVLRALQKAFDEVLVTSQEVKDFAVLNGSVFRPVTGADAQAALFKYLSPAAWSLYAAGETLVSPNIINIARP